MAAVWLEVDAAHQASRRGVALVTRIVTHGFARTAGALVADVDQYVLPFD
jgi:hypothetical protein